MKCSLILLALAGSVLMAQGATIPRFQNINDQFVSSNTHVTYNLLDDLREFVDLIPSDEILEIVFNNLGDPELQEVIAYIFSDSFRKLVLDVETIPEYKPIFAYLEGAGLPMKEWRDALHDFLGISRFAPKSSRGLVDIGREIIAILPLDELEALYYRKLQTSAAFKELVDNIRSPVFLSFAGQIADFPETQRIKRSLISKGVPVEEVIAFLKDFFGITRALTNSRSLLDDLRDFVNLIPSDEILEIVFNNLGDPELQEVIAYIFSDSFRKLIFDVEAIPEYKPIFAYLEGAGLPMKEWRDALYDFLGISRFAPTSSRGLVDIGREIIAILPLDELEALYYRKLQTSAAFKELVDNIRSPVFLSFAGQIADFPETQRIKRSLISKGVPVEEVIAFLKDFFGITRALTNSRSLLDDLRDFVNLIPSDEILEIVFNNLGDPELQEVIAYIFSDSFRKLILDVEAIPEYKPIFAYLEGAGLPMKEWRDALYDFLGISRFAPTSSRGLVDIGREIIAILPLDELEALYYRKLQTSAAFKELVDNIRSPVFLSFAGQIADFPETQRIKRSLISKGVPVEEVIAFLKDFFGITKALSSSRDLMDDLRDFIALLPTDEIINIILTNLDDPEVQEVIVYIFSEDFKNLVLEVEAIPEYEAVVAYLESAGLPVRDWIQALHDFLGITKRVTRVGSSRGLNDIINEIISILPLDEIAALYKYKLENSPAFAELIRKLESPEFRTLVDAIAKNPEVQKIAQELRNRGIPVDAFIELVKRIFGFQY